MPEPPQTVSNRRQLTGTGRINIHEYQAKALLRSYGVPVSDGRVVLKAEDAKTRGGRA